jgi:hypothetical protein
MFRSVPARDPIRSLMGALVGACLILVMLVACGDASGAQVSWRAAGSAPLSDSAAKALVQPRRETRPRNLKRNHYRPTAAELNDFHDAVYEAGPNAGRRLDALNPLVRHVTGGFIGTTDEILQWGAYKWGIPEDTLRAMAAVESDWHQVSVGDLLDGVDADEYPYRAQVDTDSAYEAFGLMHIKWRSDGSLNPGAEPLRRLSTAFQVDFAGAIIRYFYDGLCDRCGAGYGAAREWESVGAYSSSSPWGNARQLDYAQEVYRVQTERLWEEPGFEQRPYWRAAGAAPRSDEEAAALVTPRIENRPENAVANRYSPNAVELAAFHNAVYGAGPNAGSRADAYNPLLKHVTGDFTGTTDEIIQWAAHKWGIPDDLLRAIAVNESSWRQGARGDREDGVNALLYPVQSRLDSNTVYESLGLTQIKWRPDGSLNPGTEPLRWKSTAFNADYAGANIRYYFDGYCDWCGPGYEPDQEWLSVGAHYQPSPWGNDGMLSYIDHIREHWWGRPWEDPDF